MAKTSKHNQYNVLYRYNVNVSVRIEYISYFVPKAFSVYIQMVWIQNENEKTNIPLSRLAGQSISKYIKILH